MIVVERDEVGAEVELEFSWGGGCGGATTEGLGWVYVSILGWWDGV